MSVFDSKIYDRTAADMAFENRLNQVVILFVRLPFLNTVSLALKRMWI